MQADAASKGTCKPGYEAVREAFEGNFAAGNERGASVAMTVDGEMVVDLWAGKANDRGDPWEQDTIVNVFSSTKTMASLCMLMLADRGLLDMDAPVAEYWPEFGCHGKDAIRVWHVMTHTAGVPAFDPPLGVTDLYDHDKVCDNLAQQAPWWEPGTSFGYHALTQGYLQGELVRRVDGRTLGTFFAEEVARPLGADFHIGLDAAHDRRVADLVPPAESLAAELADAPPGSLAARVAAGTPPLNATEPKTRAWRAAEIPAAGGVGSARAMARVHAAMACGGALDGVRLLSSDALDRAAQVQFDGTDALMQTPARFGLGYGLPTELVPFPNPRTLFWGGWGGSLCVIDLDARMSFAYAMNRMDSMLLGDVRAVLLAIAAYTALSEQ